MPPSPKTAKLLIASISSLLALAIPLRLVSVEDAIWLVRHWGYWAILAIVLIFLRTLWPPLRDSWRARPRPSLRAQWPAALLILAATAFLHLHIDRGFKVVFDEHVLSSTARNMHLEFKAQADTVAHHIGGELIARAAIVDKRPTLFPFVLSTLHHLTGYRPANVFWLNSILTFLFLSLLYGIVHRSCGRGHGMLAVLLATSLPLLAQNTNGGGYEILNLCLLCTLILAGTRYLRSEGSVGLDLLVLSAVLLANNRYESILYVVVPVALFLVKSWRDRQLELTWTTALAPLALILPLLSFTAFQGRQEMLGTSPEDFFNLDHISGNALHALVYLFDPSGDFSNSLVLSIAGTVAVAFLVLQGIRRFKTILGADPLLPVLAVTLLPVLAATLLYLSHHWGAWTDPAASRFSLPLQLFLILSVPLALRFDFKRERPPFWLFGLVVVYIFGVTGPHTKRIETENRLEVSVGYEWAINWIREHRANERSLILAESVTGFSLYGQSGVPFITADRMPERVMWTKEAGIYQEIYALEPFFHNGAGREAHPGNWGRLDDRYILEPVADHHLHVHLFYRISRVLGLKPRGEGLPGDPADALLTPPPARANAAELRDYLKDSLPVLPESIPY